MKSREQIFPNFYSFHSWRNPSPNDVGDSALEFLQRLDGPTHIYIAGEDPSRCRVAVTLLHGNEPSGFFAIYHLLKHQVRPAVDMHCFILSVAAAKAPPGFHYRMLPGQQDLNRCFQPPFDTNPQRKLAKGLLETIAFLKPESVIDIHNTSGSGPAFGVTTFMDNRHDALVSLFTQRLIVTDLSLGALMEISESLVPTVTIECGGAQDSEAHILAREGLERYFTHDNVLLPPSADFALELFHNPMRLELTDSAIITYDELPQRDAHLTMAPDIERFNFGFVNEETELGFINGDIEDAIVVKNARGHSTSQDYFQATNGILRPTQELKLFMVTTNPEIAKKDCLFYFVPDPESATPSPL